MTNWKAISALCIIFFLVGLLLGGRFGRPEPSARTKIDSNVILTALQDRGFLVSQSYFFDQSVVIKKSAGSALKDIFFGQTITARGTVEVNLGIDLGRLTAEDISVEEDKVTVRISPASIFNSRLTGPLEVKNEKGLIKILLDRDSGYNEALTALTREAEAAAERPVLLERSTERAKEDLVRLINYVAPGKKAEIRVK